ncbi:MAG: restriction endonuclease subunit S [Candidatus Contendobacter sp.]|nr:MAG: restriction endonuclease subunit S [Candidatus Contendobacter sp.]
MNSRGWDTARLGDHCSKIGSGATPRGGESVYQDNGVSFIRSQNVYNGQFAIDGLAHLNDDHAEMLKGVTVESGDVLLNITGDSVARSCRVPDEVLPARVNQHVAIIRPEPEKFDSRFIAYFLISPFMQDTMLSLAGSGGTRKALTKEMIERFAVPKPPLPVQICIASILSTYDDLIENNRRRMALLEESARLLYREWFVRLCFPGHEHTRIIDGVPEGWEKRNLGSVAEVNRQSLTAAHDGEIEYVDISSVTPNHINETTTYNFRDAPSRARRIAQHGDIIWSCVRPNRRSHAVIWQLPSNLIVSTGFAVITPTELPTSYLYQATTTDAFVGYLENHARGAAYPAVVAGDFERAMIVVPPKMLVASFDELVKPLLMQTHNLQQQNQKIRAARDLLLPRLMSGEIAV